MTEELPYFSGWFGLKRPDLRLRWVPWSSLQELFAVPYEEWDLDQMEKLGVRSFNSEKVKNSPITGVEWSPSGSWIRVPLKGLSPVQIAQFAFWVEALPNSGWSTDEEIVEDGGFLYISISPD